MKKVFSRAALALFLGSVVSSVSAAAYNPDPTDSQVNSTTKDVYRYLAGRRDAAGGTNKMVEGQHLGGINDILKDGGLAADGKLDYEVHGIADQSGATRYPGFVGVRYDDKQKYSLAGDALAYNDRFETLDPTLNQVLNDNLIELWNLYHPIVQITASPRNPWNQSLGRLPDDPANQNIGNLVRSVPLTAGSPDEIARAKFWTEMGIIADGLKQLSDAGVPVILRPFAEWNTGRDQNGNGTKYWGEQQVGADFIALWNDVHDFYTGSGTPGVPPGGIAVPNRGLHNLLFCWEVWALNRGGINAYIDETHGIATFYPAGKVDIVGGSYYFKTGQDYIDANGNFTFAQNDPDDAPIYEYLVSKDRPFIASQYGLNNQSPDPGHHDDTLAFMSYVSSSSGLNPMAAAYYWNDPQQVERQGDAAECARFVSENRVATADDLPYTTVAFVSEAVNDGYLREQNETLDTADFLDNTAGNLKAGDTGTSTEKQYKSIVSFNTYGLPDAKNVVSAILSLRRNTVVGTPFDDLGACQIDIKNGKFGTGVGAQALAFEDFSNTLAPASEVAVVAGGMPQPPTDGDWSDGFLNAKGIFQVNRTGNTQFRVYFAADDDDDQSSDFINWYSGDAAAASRPVLLVTYRN